VYISAHSVESLRQLNFEVLNNPPYSPDLITFDYHLFLSIKGVLKATDSPVTKKIKKQHCVACHSTKLAFFSERIHKLLNCKFPGGVITDLIHTLWEVNLMLTLKR
jgi:hypothetical protein